MTKQNLRNGFSVIAAGTVSNAEDTAKLLALGADCVSTGTATLVGLGCLMVHKCHIGFCPALLTNKLVDDPTKVLSLDKSVEWTSKMIFGWIEEFKWILRELNLNSASELVGRRDLLRGYNIHEETADILGVELDHSSKSLVGSQPIQKQIPEDEYWTPILQGELRELSGSAGRNPGEAVIASMGTITAPFVAQPRSVCDWIRSDGAQVTRPSIDPYREEIETSTYLANGDIRLSNPIYLGRLNEEGSILNIFSEVSSSMGLLYNSQKLIDASKTSLNSSLLIPYSEFLNNDKSGVKCITVDYNEIDKIEKLSEYDVHIMVRFPSNEQTIKSISSIIDKNISGIIIDWDLDKNNDTLDLAICTSEVDNILRSIPFKSSIARNKINLLVEGSRIRGAADIFKLIGLGADAAGISKAALLSINYDPKKFRNDSNESNFDQDKTREKLEYTILALQKEIKLLAGAAGISSTQNSLLGNRELFRSVDLDPLIRKRLGIKAGGAP